MHVVMHFFMHVCCVISIKYEYDIYARLKLVADVQTKAISRVILLNC